MGHFEVLLCNLHMLLVTETNHGLAYDRDVEFSFDTFYILQKHTPQKSVF